MYLPRGPLARAALRRRLGDFRGARADLAETEELARFGSMKLHLTDYHLESEHLGLAEALIEETGYNRSRTPP